MHVVMGGLSTIPAVKAIIRDTLGHPLVNADFESGQNESGERDSWRDKTQVKTSSGEMIQAK